MTSHSKPKLLGITAVALALLSVVNLPGASAAAVIVPNGTGCPYNDTFFPAGAGGEYSCVIAATTRCTLTIIVTDGAGTNYLYQKNLNLGTPTWIVLVSVPVGFTVGASCPVPA